MISRSSCRGGDRAPRSRPAIQQCRLRRRPAEVDGRQPRRWRRSTRYRHRTEAVTEQQLREPVPGAHQIQPQLSRARTRSRNASSSGPGTRTGCSFPASSSRPCARHHARRFSPGPRRARIFDGAATTHSTPASSVRARGHTRSGRPHTRRAPVVADRRRTRPPPPSRPHRERLQLPVSASKTAATIFVACTSRPTRDLAFAMAGSSIFGCGPPRGCSRAAEHHPHNAWGTGPFYRPSRTTDNPYGLCRASRPANDGALLRVVRSAIDGGPSGV